MSELTKFVEAYCKDNPEAKVRDLVDAIDRQFLPALVAKLARQVNVLFCDPFLPPGFCNAVMHDDRPGMVLVVGGREVSFTYDWDALMSAVHKHKWEIYRHEAKDDKGTK